MNDVLDWILQTVQNVDPVLRTLLAGLGVMLETSVLIGLIVPGDTIVLVASTAIENPVQYTALVVAVIVGAIAGESIGYAIGRWFGPHLVRSRLGRRIGTDHWERAQRYVDRRGGPAVFLSRFLPVLHSLVPLVVGMSAMRYRRFIAWTLPACIIWAFAYATVGWLAADSYRELSRELHWAGYVFVAAIAVFLLVVWLVKRVIVRVEARHFEADAAATAGAEEPDAVASQPSVPGLSALGPSAPGPSAPGPSATGPSATGPSVPGGSAPAERDRGTRS